MNEFNYVLLTATRNEEKFIENTIKSIISQTKLPKLWLIVDDNSIDNTAKVVESYKSDNQFIQLLSLKNNSSRDFCSKVAALNKGLEQILMNDFDFIGILDADITLPDFYYEKLIAKFFNEPDLGIGGGELSDIFNNTTHQIIQNPDNVRGGIQFFKRECFLEIKKFTPIAYGGEDTVAEYIAKSKGWKVKTFPDIKALHHRRTGTGVSNILRFRFREGIQEQIVGYSTIFQMIKSIKRITEKPYLIGSTLRLLGFWWSKLKFDKPAASKEIVRYIRNEQNNRVKELLRPGNYF